MIHLDGKHGDGFSLIELVIVVAVVLVMSGAAAVTLPRYQADGLLNAASQLESVLSVTRETAIALRSPLAVTLNVASNSVSYTRPGGQDATLEFSSAIRYPVGFGSGNSPVMRFDAFGHPTTQYLPSGSDASGSVFNYVTLETKGSGFIIEVLVHENTGETEIKWINR